MSGKKAWEVANVLEQVESVRDKNVQSYVKKIEEEKEIINTLNENIKRLYSEIQKGNIGELFYVKKEFVKEYEKIENVIKDIKNIQLKSFDVSSIERSLKNILDTMQKYNKEARQIRESIKNKTHYATNEYNQAQDLKKRYTELQKNLEKLYKESLKLKEEAIKEDSNLESRKKRLDEIIKKSFDLEKEAKRIHNQKEAKNLRNSLKEKFESIDIKKANKFAKNEYEHLKKEIKEFFNLSDEAVIRNYSLISSKVSELDREIDKRYREFKEKEKNSKELLESALNMVKKDFILLEDWVEYKNNYISALEYVDFYEKKNTKEEFERLIKEAQSLIEAEKFEEADKKIIKAKELYEESLKEAVKLREKIEASFNLTTKIADIMANKIGYDVYVDVIDGDVTKGFKIECNNGDTIIFDKVFVGDNGVEVELDHIEGAGGSCGVKWKDLQKTFNEEGIPLTDVTKNGHSVIFYDVRKPTLKLKPTIIKGRG